MKRYALILALVMALAAGFGCAALGFGWEAGFALGLSESELNSRRISSRSKP